MPVTTSNHDDALKQKIIERLRKLFAVANCAAATEAEVESAMNLARKIMEANDLEEHEVLVHDEDAREAAYDSIVDEAPIKRKTCYTFDRHIGMACAYTCGCSMYFTNDRDDGCIHFYGLPVDVAVATALFRELLEVAKTMARVRYGDEWSRTHHVYCDGFGSHLRHRAYDAKQQAEAQACTTTAIVLCKDQIVKRWAQNKLGLRTTRKSTHHYGCNTGAFHAGWSDGANVDLGAKNRITA